MIIKRKEKPSKEKERKEKVIKNSLLGSGLIASGALLGRNLEQIQKKIVSSTEIVPEDLKKENKKLFKKLQRQAKKDNVEVITNPKQSEGLNKKVVNFKSGPYSLNNIGPYTAKEDMKYVELEAELADYKDTMKKHEKILKENLNMKKKVNDYNSILHRKRNRAKFKSDSSSFAVIPGEKGKKPLAADLSHELGHLDGIENRSKSKSNNYFHKNNNFIRKLNKNSKKISNSASILTGLTTGIKDGRKEENNKSSDEIKSSAAIITASTIPHINILGREYNATKSGLKKLKESGASKKYIKFAKKRLGRAYGTYIARVAPSILMGLGSREIGKIIGRKTNHDKNTT